MNGDTLFTGLILDTVVRPMLLLLVATIGIRFFRVRHPASQHAVWTVVLAGLLVVPLLSRVIPHFELALLPALPASSSREAPDVVVRSDVKNTGEPDLDPLLLRERGIVQVPSAGTTAKVNPVPTTFQTPLFSSSPWLFLYVAGLVLVAVYHAVGWLLLRRVLSGSQRLAAAPLCISNDVIVPVTAGVLRPVVILPRDWRSLNVETRRVVLAHEFAHIRRKDLLTAALAHLAKCVLWFNPLVWWVSRKVAALAELACDAAVLQRTDPAVYSRILLDFAGRVHGAGYRVTAPGLAMVNGSGLRNRIDEVFAMSARDLRKPARAGILLLVVGIPMMCLSAAFSLSRAAAEPVRLAPQTAVHPAEGVASPEVRPLLELATVSPEPAVAAVPVPVPVPVQSAAAARSLLNDYCIRCHNSQLSAAGLSLVGLEVDDPSASPRIWEKVLRTLRARSMPPTGVDHPDRGTNDSVVAWLERALDATASPATWPVRSEALSDQELAVRMADFLWSSPPDDELKALAERGQLKQARTLERQVRRMLADSKSNAFIANYFGGWLGLQELAQARPSANLFPDFDDSLRAAMQRETEMFLDSQVHDNRGALELLTANYTFVNARLARHYGLSNISGNEFRRVALSDERRAGLLGQASILTLTSQPERISPNLRGKWILLNILGQAPPPPPPSVPALPVDPPGRSTPIRVRMERHVAAPRCMSCHLVMDPPGYALENFNAIGQWQDVDAAVPVDASGRFPDGAIFNGPIQFRAALLDRQDAILNNFAERLLAYALGRRADNGGPKFGALDYYEMPAVREIVRLAAPADYRWAALITAVVNSTPFQTRLLGDK